MKRIFMAQIASLLFACPLCAQSSFADACVGSWKETMYMYRKGILNDSVPVRLTVNANKQAASLVLENRIPVGKNAGR